MDCRAAWCFVERHRCAVTVDGVGDPVHDDVISGCLGAAGAASDDWPENSNNGDDVRRDVRLRRLDHIRFQRHVDIDEGDVDWWRVALVFVALVVIIPLQFHTVVLHGPLGPCGTRGLPRRLPQPPCLMLHQRHRPTHPRRSCRPASARATRSTSRISAWWTSPSSSSFASSEMTHTVAGGTLNFRFAWRSRLAHLVSWPSVVRGLLFIGWTGSTELYIFLFCSSRLTKTASEMT